MLVVCLRMSRQPKMNLLVFVELRRENSFVCPPDLQDKLQKEKRLRTDLSRHLKLTFVDLMQMRFFTVIQNSGKQKSKD